MGRNIFCRFIMSVREPIYGEEKAIRSAALATAAAAALSAKGKDCSSLTKPTTAAAAAEHRERIPSSRGKHVHTKERAEEKSQQKKHGFVRYTRCIIKPVLRLGHRHAAHLLRRHRVAQPPALASAAVYRFTAAASASLLQLLLLLRLRPSSTSRLHHGSLFFVRETLSSPLCPQQQTVALPSSGRPMKSATSAATRFLPPAREEKMRVGIGPPAETKLIFHANVHGYKADFCYDFWSVKGVRTRDLYSV